MNYTSPKLLPNKIIIIDGIARTGKLLLATLVSSFSKTEHFELGRNFEDISPSIKFKKIKIDYAEAFIKNNLNELIYNKYLSRNVNFRPTDRTGVYNSSNFKLYKKRLKTKEGDRVIKLIKKEKRNILFVTHDLMTTISSFNKLNLKYKMIYLYRNPFDTIISWYKRGHGKRLGEDLREFSLLIKNKKKKFPWYQQLIGKFNKMEEVEACATFIYHLNKNSIRNFKKLDKKYKKNILVFDYLEIIQNKNNELKTISKFLKSSFTKKTNDLLKEERLGKINLDNYFINLEKRKKFIKSKINQELFFKLLDQEKKLNLNIYN